MSTSNNQSTEVEPIRQSTAALVIRLIILLFLVDTAYGLLFLGVILFNPTEPLHQGIFVLFLIAFVIKYIVLTYYVVRTVIQWSGKFCYLSDHFLIKKEGTVALTENRFELEQLKTVRIHQDWLGKRFNYGNVELKLAASGFSDTVVLSDIKDPIACEKMFSKYY